MNVTVISEKESVIYKGIIYGNGQSFDVDDTIGESLIERGLVAGTAEVEMDEGCLDENQLKEMSYQEVKRLAAQMGLDATGKKEELIARICATEGDANAEDENIESDNNATQGENNEGEEGDANADGDGDLPNTSMPE